MRDVFTFTIDPADARDFDDALSFERIKCPNGAINDQMVNDQMVNDQMVNYQIGVHIADVSHYVRPGTKVDDDAYKRGTSVYLVDRVLPMLPEELCNDLCSLRPGEDKLCMSVIFTFEVPLDTDGQPVFADARVPKYKICRTVIRSDARLDYDQAQILIDQLPGSAKSTSKHEGGAKTDSRMTEAIGVLHALAQKFRAERIANGAMAIAQDEMHFRLDGQGYPTEIYFEEHNEAHQLIEEFMLLANRTVARAVGSGKPFVYRVHDLPDMEKLEAVKTFQRKMGNRVSPQAIELLTIRAQAKAVYSTYNIGHYGLAFTHYTHFTSPIRRYPDLMVHRLVEKYILTGKKISLTREELEEKCEHCSACEQDAVQAERDSIKMFQALWMSGHIGEIYAGHISGVTDFGLFIQLDESRCEGLVHITRIGEPGEYWLYDEENYRLVCENKDTQNDSRPAVYTLGDPVMVKVVRADANKGQIDFEWP